MPDYLDAVQDRVLADTDLALAEHQRQRAQHATNGRDLCTCGEPIADARRRDGAQRCVECQTAHEQREARLWGRRT